MPQALVKSLTFGVQSYERCRRVSEDLSASRRPKLVFVTDPMCSWCWGMTTEFENARKKLAEQADFELMLGGINTHGTQYIGDYGRRYLMRLWREVAATTGQSFGFQLPERYVHNSVSACLAVEAVRTLSNEVPFEFLAELQRLFFVKGVDITCKQELAAAAAEFGVVRDVFLAKMEDPKLLKRLQFQFDHAHTFGTQALPSLLREDEQGILRLMAGGYLDAAMLEELLGALEHSR